MLMDIQIPRQNGVQATTTYPGARIVVLTPFDYQNDVFEAVRAGVICLKMCLQPNWPQDLYRRARRCQ
ncbi:MAG TPA: hypothetical protein VGF67_04060 [Ktedonobacteraceae bacterium]